MIIIRLRATTDILNQRSCTDCKPWCNPRLVLLISVSSTAAPQNQHYNLSMEVRGTAPNSVNAFKYLGITVLNDNKIDQLKPGLH